MKDVPGWVTGTWYGEPVYFTLGEKWWDPTQLVSCFDFFIFIALGIFRSFRRSFIVARASLATSQ